MNVKHVIGLAAIVLGGMTSCSNILEEDGVANVITKGETGVLRLNLVTDGALNVTTKSTQINLPANEYDKFIITGRRKTGESEPESVQLGTYSNYNTENKTYTVQAGEYSSITGTNGEMETTLGWDCPKFSGTSTKEFTVSANNNKAAEASLTAVLTNSVITVDNTKLQNLTNAVYISKLFVYKGTKDTEPATIDFDLLNDDNKDKTLFVKAGEENVYIWLQGTHQQTGTMISSCTQIKDTGESATSGKKSYTVQYDLKEDQGELELSITIDGEAKIENIPVTIDPYPNKQ